MGFGSDEKTGVEQLREGISVSGSSKSIPSLFGKYSKGVSFVAAQLLDVESDNGFISDSFTDVPSEIRESRVLEGLFKSAFVFEPVDLGGLPRVAPRQLSTI